MFLLVCSVIFWSTLCGHIPSARGDGFMLLYRPRDVTRPCSLSQYLRYDLSFGMGMSDTITLVFRTLYEADYECTVDIVAESGEVVLLIVVRYPNHMGINCKINNNAITVFKKERCLRLCDFAQNPDSAYTTFPVMGRLRFRFISNSSVNSDMKAYVYQVTATAARPSPAGCFKRNETICVVNGQIFCFTSGVVCDGIRNCGMNDWFDERRSQCGLPIEKLGFAPVVAVAAALLCAALAVGHLLLRCLPAQAESFFIFNANEDNRLCIDPVLKPRRSTSPELEKTKRDSLIPVYASSSSESVPEGPTVYDSVGDGAKPAQPEREQPNECDIEVASPTQRKMTMRKLTAKIQETLRFVTGSRNLSKTLPIGSENETQNV